MENINLPPFYIGQRVVRIIVDQTGTIKKGSEHTVSDIKYCCVKWGWRIELKGIVPPKRHYCECGRPDTPIFAAKNFAPIEENFETISYKEAIRKEKPLTCAN